jgi:HSP20 family protein
MFYQSRQQCRGNQSSANKNPFETFRRVDEIFNHFFGMPGNAPQKQNYSGQVRETEKEVIVSLDAPGFEANEFEIQVNEEAVTIKAEHVVKEGDETRAERTLKREFALPTLVDPSKVDAKYRNGVLELHLPKAEQAQWRKVDVKAE